MDNTYVTVIGGMNADIIGTPDKRPIMTDSNPGQVTVTAGGVARNIAENIAKMGIHSKMLSAVGNDFFGNFILNASKKAGVDVSNVIQNNEHPTSTFLCLNDEKGDMHFAVNDMEIMDLVTPEYIEANLDLINNGKALVIDANIREDSLRYIRENVTVPIFADAVSENKAHKYLPLMNKINTVKVNLLEAEILSGMRINSLHDAKDAAFEIQNKGVLNVYLTMGPNGVVYCGDFEAGMLPCYKSKVVNTTGCGDAFMAALIYGFMKGYNAKQCAKAGLASASMCITTHKTVCENISSENIERIMGGKKYAM